MHSAAVQNGPLSFVKRFVTDTKKTNNISAPKNILHKKQDCVHKISFSFFLSDPFSAFSVSYVHLPALSVFYFK